MITLMKRGRLEGPFNILLTVQPSLVQPAFGHLLVYCQPSENARSSMGESRNPVITRSMRRRVQGVTARGGDGAAKEEGSGRNTGPTAARHSPGRRLQAAVGPVFLCCTPAHPRRSGAAEEEGSGSNAGPTSALHSPKNSWPTVPTEKRGEGGGKRRKE